MYSIPVARIKVNEAYTDWFDTISVVKPGEPLSVPLFGIYIYNLVTELNSYVLGVKFEYIMISILLIAHNIVLITDSELI